MHTLGNTLLTKQTDLPQMTLDLAQTKKKRWENILMNGCGEINM